MKVKIFFLIFLMNVASYCGCGECDCCDCCEYCDCWEKCWGENKGNNNENNGNNESEKNGNNNENNGNNGNNGMEKEGDPKSLVNETWLKGKAKQENFALILFDKIGNEDKYKSKDRKIIIELENNNEKTVIKDLNNVKDTLKTATGKWALFEIKTVNNGIYYLYCSDIESRERSIVKSRESSIVKSEESSIVKSEVISFVYGIFEDQKDLSTISVLACDTSKVINMRKMFAGCSNLNNINFSNNFNTQNVTDMSYMFDSCHSLVKFDLSKFNTEKVINMCCMFINCSKLADLDLSSFNTKNVTDMGYMFEGCRELKIINLYSFNTQNVTNMRGMFSFCITLKELDISSFNIQNKTDISGMLFFGNVLEKIMIKREAMDKIFENNRREEKKEWEIQESETPDTVVLIKKKNNQ